VNIATVQGTDKDAKIYYTATDNLNSSSVITDSTGTIAETMDYFPFGQIRIYNLFVKIKKAAHILVSGLPLPVP